jgi:zinc/manganese transport system substrate-binding protein
MPLRAILNPKLAVGALMLVAACGGAGGSSGGPSIVVTTSVLGDMVERLVGDQAEVTVLMPRGADPHEASLSSRQADEMSRADLVVAIGAGFEQNMSRVIDSVEDDGTPVVRVADEVELLTFAEQHEAQEAAAGDAHAGEDQGAGEEQGHSHDPDDVDPHVWTDPTRWADATRALADHLAGVEGIDGAAVEAAASGYVDDLELLDASLSDVLAAVPEGRRMLVTNHEVFGYFADRYGFEVVGAVIPAGTTQAEPSSSEVTDLAEVIRDTGVPAIFVETSSPTALAEALADEVGEVEVVELFSESLGADGSGASTYLQMMRTNAARIAEGLA